MRNLIAERGLGLPREPSRAVVTSTSRHTHPHPPHAQRARGAAAANDPFPGVEKVRPGLWSIPVPLPNNSLRYVLVYVFETDRGPYLVDAGWNTDDAFGALQSGLEEAGCDIGDVQGVMVTHIHPDHYGLAGRIREASGAWISLHPADAELIHDRYDEPDDLLDRVAAALAPDGGARRGARAAAQRGHAGPAAGRPGGARRAARGRRTARGAGVGPARPSGRRGTRRATCASTSPATSSCSRATTCSPASPPTSRSTPRPARTRWATSCSRSTSSSPTRSTRSCRPTSTASTISTTRLEELRQHHRDRFAEVDRDPATRGPTTAWDIASHMKWSRPWDDIAGFMRRAAVGETVSHLRVLEIDGVVQVEDGEPALWSLADRAG